MQKKLAEMLQAEALSVADYLSGSDRPNNFNSETFTVHAIRVLSEHAAAVIYEKQPGGKLALVLFYVMNPHKAPKWRWLAVTDSHVLGFAKLGKFLEGIEKHNFPRNFEHTKPEQPPW